MFWKKLRGPNGQTGWIWPTHCRRARFGMAGAADIPNNIREKPTSAGRPNGSDQGTASLESQDLLIFRIVPQGQTTGAAQAYWMDLSKALQTQNKNRMAASADILNCVSEKLRGPHWQTGWT